MSELRESVTPPGQIGARKKILASALIGAEGHFAVSLVYMPSEILSNGKLKV
jgi:hypothetical protein